MKQIANFDGKWNKSLAIMIIIVAIVYGVNPIDLIPDVALGLGQIDDIVVLLLAICNAWIQFRKGEN